MLRTILTRIEANARFFPKKPAIILPDRMINYEMLLNGIFSIQSVIYDLRLSRGAPVGLLVDNPIRHIIIFLALIRSGFTVTSMRREHFRTSGVNNQIIISDQDLIFGSIKVVSVRDDWFARRHENKFGEYAFEENRIARIVFTSGSTGKPKAIGLSFRTMEKKIEELQTSGVCVGKRFLTTYGLSNAGLKYAFKSLVNGNTLLFSKIEDALDMALTYCVDEFRCSAVQANTLINFQKQLRYPLTFNTISVGGGQLNFEVANKLRSLFGCEIISTLISTEAGLAGLARGEILKKHEFIGNCFFPTARIEIVDEDGAPSMKEGRIRIKSDAMGWEFNGDMIEDDDVKGDGWFYPGDIGYIDDEGLLVVTGRADEVINIGGVKFAPEIIEDRIKAYQGLDDAAVVRVTFDKDNTHPCLAIVTTENITMAEINDWLPKQFIGELESVQFHKIIKVDSIPKTGTGKIARNEIRKLFLN
jgi:acyl-coenzyme A synthetase/AMP-(fatty) acid ligase